MLKKVRIDKWLWSVRIFKTRTLATNACKTGKVKIDGENVKPSYLVQREEVVQVRKEGFDLQFKVLDLIEKRVGAPIAQKCYENLTSEEELNKYKDWFIGKGRPEVREKGTGRPTKKDRRQIEEFKDWDEE
ncbi:MAG: RNA-binding S4 domain-containing protein [Bacteroidota bacterium]